jgi:hypothetical protein
MRILFPSQTHEGRGTLPDALMLQGLCGSTEVFLLKSLCFFLRAARSFNSVRLAVTTLAQGWNRM